jgi:uncharacterized protein
MKNIILWSGIEYYSIENCTVERKDKSVIVNSVIIGLYDEMIYRVKYDIQLDKNWNTKSCLIESQINYKIKKTKLVKRRDGWYLNGEIRSDFNECTDIDIPLTPLTNSLPVNRLQLTVGQETKVTVIYFDLLEDTIKPVRQKYKRISQGIFKYENIPNDFEAEIQVDEAGFVIDYPPLFQRKVKV